jgi:hypothetical protein
MEYFWVIGQVGIVFEIVGAGCIVRSAFRSRKAMRGLGQNVGYMDNSSNTVEELVSVVKKQYTTELIGFIILGLGLCLQFIGGMPAHYLEALCSLMK